LYRPELSKQKTKEPTAWPKESVLLKKSRFNQTKKGMGEGRRGDRRLQIEEKWSKEKKTKQDFLLKFRGKYFDPVDRSLGC